MKKFTFLIIALLAIAGYAKAEVDASIATKKVTAVGEATTTIDTNAWYLLYNQARTCYVSEETTGFKMRLTSNFVAPVAAADKAGYLYQFESTGNDNEYYIKSGNGLYFMITQGGSTVSTEPVAYTIAQIGDNAGHFYGVMVSDGRVLDGNGAGGALAGWGTTTPTSTGGNNDYQFLPVTMEDAYIAVTYNFTYNGEVKYTQTSAVEEGSDFPDYTVTLPYGITAAAKPAETVNADNATQEIALAVDESMIPFQTSTIDGSFGDGVKWYYLTMRSRDVTYDASTGYALAQNVDTKGATNLFAFTGNPVDGYSIYNYAAGADKVFWRADATDGGRVSFTNIDETNGNTWMLSANGTNGYVFRLKGYDNGYMNDHQPEIAIWNSSWGATDGGSTITFTFVEDPQLRTFYEVTYNYQYKGETKFSQTIKVEEGASFPAHSYTTPYGVSIAEEVPAETVTETTTKTFTLNIDKEVPFEEGKWYYAQLHMNPEVTSYIQDNNNSIVEWADKDFTAGEIDSHLWKFEGNVWDGIKVINKATGNAITSTSGNAATGDATNATAFFISNSQASNASCFCLKYPGTNSYLNAQGEQIKSWNANDNGSSFLLTEYKEKDITISEATYATLYLDYAAFIPEGVTASAITGTVTSSNGNYVELGAIEEDDAIPANEGVILNGEAATYTFKLAPAATAFETNLLEGTTTDSYITEEAYVLSVVDGKVGLYLADKNQEGGTAFKNNAFKAYLPASATSDNAAITFYSFGFDWGGTTGIENIEDAVEENATKAIYDITGRQIKAITVPGIYIINGKKTFVK